MKRTIMILAASVAMSLAVFAQTPVPRPAPAAPAVTAAAAAAPTGGTGAEGKVAVLRTDAFRMGLIELKAKLDGLNTEFESKRKALETKQANLENLKNKLQTQGNTVSAAVRNQWVEEATSEEKLLKRMDEDYQADGQKRLGDVQGPVFDKVGKLLEGYCQQRGIIIVLEAGAAQQAGVLIFAAAATDITEDFMKEYNKANPAAAGPTASAAPKK